MPSGTCRIFPRRELSSRTSPLILARRQGSFCCGRKRDHRRPCAHPTSISLPPWTRVLGIESRGFHLRQDPFRRTDLGRSGVRPRPQGQASCPWNRRSRPSPTPWNTATDVTRTSHEDAVQKGERIHHRGRSSSPPVAPHAPPPANRDAQTLVRRGRAAASFLIELVLPQGARDQMHRRPRPLASSTTTDLEAPSAHVFRGKLPPLLAARRRPPSRANFLARGTTPVAQLDRATVS